MITMSDTLTIARNAMLTRSRIHHVAINVAKIVNMRTDEELRRDVEEGDIVNADGMGVVWAARAFGLPIPERVTGVDLMFRLLEVCAQEGFRPYILGAREDVLHQAANNAIARWPNLKFAGLQHGYFSADEEQAVAAAIQQSKPDCLFVAMTSPRKERFCRKWRDDIGVPFVMGVGGSVDILSGITPRAPSWMQAAGLEWLYRVVQEPRRMWRRYLVTNTKFLGLMAAGIFRRTKVEAVQERSLFSSLEVQTAVVSNKYEYQ